jgi:hypothetical protein
LVKEARKLIPGLERRHPVQERFLPAELVHGNLVRLRKLGFDGRHFTDYRGDALASISSERAERLDPALTNARRVPASQLLCEAAARPVRVFENAHASDRPRALLVSDRLGQPLLPHLAEQFARCVYVWSPEPPIEAVELESPDVVFHVKDERFLNGPPGEHAVELAG